VHRRVLVAAGITVVGSVVVRRGSIVLAAVVGRAVVGRVVVAAAVAATVVAAADVKTLRIQAGAGAAPALSESRVRYQQESQAGCREQADRHQFSHGAPPNTVEK